MTAEAITRAEGRGSWVLWTGMLTGPLAWSLQLGSNWLMAEVIACAPAAQAPGTILGLPLEGVVAGLNTVLLTATLLSGVLALRSLRAIGRRGDGSPGRRAEWMARAGVMTAALFIVVIATGFGPVVLVEACR